MLRKTLKLRLALMLGSLVFALVIAEFGLRLAGAYSPASLHLSPPNTDMRDVETDWDITYHSNSQGLRDDEYTAAKPDGTIRIVVIGDSFTFGQGCQRGEIFPDLLEARLNAAGYHAQVINVSHVGIGPESYFVLLQSIALKYRPDVVVLNTFGNDASEVKKSSLPSRLVRSLSHSSNLFVLLRALRYRMAQQAQSDFWTTVEAQANNNKSADSATRVADFRKEHGTAPNNLVAASVGDPQEVARWIDTPVDGAGWSQFQDYVGAMANICRTHGIKFVIGIIPDGAQVDPHQLAMRQKFGVPLRESVLTESGKFQQLVHEFATAKGIMCLDPLTKFRAVGAGLYFDSDLHWSPAGHKLYADLLADYLETQVL
jgi:lysophospholipase L1-like esterase